MAVELVNRFGDRYFLQSKPRARGSPYYCSRKMTGTPVESLPDGYQLYESPDTGQVHLRKIKPSVILHRDVELTRQAIRSGAGLSHAIVEVDGDEILIWLPNYSEAEARQATEVFGPSRRMSVPETVRYLVTNSRFSKEMRFRLVDEAKRHFDVQRWCYRGSIDDWIWIGGPAPLETLLKKFVPHLGKENFYDLI